MGGWAMGPRVGLQTMKKRKIFVGLEVLTVVVRRLLSSGT
jgi:hypothetical protein